MQFAMVFYKVRYGNSFLLRLCAEFSTFRVELSVEQLLLSFDTHQYKVQRLAKVQ